jgi:hypothetical protein
LKEEEFATHGAKAPDMMSQTITASTPHREIPLGKLVVAIILQGAISASAAVLAHHGARHAFVRLAGEWPG